MIQDGINSMVSELIQADLAYDLWDIEGGDLPGYVEDGEIVVAVTDVGLSGIILIYWQCLAEPRRRCRR